MQEIQKNVASGWVMLLVAIVAWIMVPVIISSGAMDHENVGVIILGILMIPTAFLISWGLFTLQPNEARVLVLFGNYVGTVRQPGFHWANPFSVHRSGVSLQPKPGRQNEFEVAGAKNRFRVSLRARNFQTDVLKVNDERGNPIDIAAVIVWRVEDTAKAIFDVDEYENYVKVQSETAIRHLASSYPYDHGDEAEENELTLRGGAAEVSQALQAELQERLEKVGVVIDEARLTHLAYAAEIAQAMLRRQQAEAVIAARRKIVHGAVSMVQMALHDLSAQNVVALDEEHKAQMVGNLLVVLCGETQAEPVINTGTLYR